MVAAVTAVLLDLGQLSFDADSLICKLFECIIDGLLFEFLLLLYSTYI